MGAEGNHAVSGSWGRISLDGNTLGLVKSWTIGFELLEEAVRHWNELQDEINDEESSGS